MTYEYVIYKTTIYIIAGIIIIIFNINIFWSYDIIIIRRGTVYILYANLISKVLFHHIMINGTRIISVR